MKQSNRLHAVMRNSRGRTPNAGRSASFIPRTKLRKLMKKRFEFRTFPGRNFARPDSNRILSGTDYSPFREKQNDLGRLFQHVKIAQEN